MAEGPLLLAISQLRISQKYSDLTLVCQQQEFKVHKAIVCSQSPVLAAACDGEFKEKTTNTIEVKEFNADALARMIQFLYTADYDCEQEKCKDECRSTACNAILVEHIHVIAIAEYYDIPQLVERANKKIKDILRKRGCAEHLPAAMDEVFYTTNDKDLRDSISSAAAARIHELLKLDEFKNSENMGPLPLDIIGKMITG